MTALVAGGQRVYATDVTMPAPVQSEDLTDLTITNTAPVPGSPVVGVVFTAPPSGRVRVHLLAGLRISTPATGAVHIIASVRAGTTIGSGALVFDGTNEPGLRGFLAGMIGYITTTASVMVEGLTAAAQYNVQAQHYVVSGTTGIIMYRRVGVDPLP